MKFESSLKFARSLDRQDPLKSFRGKFRLPKKNGKSLIYLAGNSLGLQPKSTKTYITEELEDWATQGVEGHFNSKRPWLYYHKFAKKTLAKLVGGRQHEVIAMNQLTVNLHLLMVSFYKPTKERFKIITEEGAFPSDQYAFESQIKFHGFDPQKTLVELKPQDGRSTLTTKEITDAIELHKNELALVILGGVQYYTGQFFNIKAITEAAHYAGAIAAFDLAHAVGNVMLNLHDDGVDFAVWCSYKYLNSGPGGIAGAFVHEKFASSFDLPRFAGWWGHNEAERFKMEKGFKPMHGIDGWQVSNVPVLSAAAHLASLEIFEEAGIKNIRKKSELLTGYLAFMLKEIDPEERFFYIITPANRKERGCQLSILMKSNGEKVFKRLEKQGVVVDWREPNVIRVAPVPLYNTFEEVFKFAQTFKDAVTIKK
jgi:kynureninase